MPPMAMELKVDTDAEEVGFDAGRLERIDRHFARYVEEGQLPGWLIVVTRRGRVAHLSRCGHADVESGRPVEVDTLWRIFSMTKPVTSVAAMMLFEEGAFDLTDPIARWLPEFAQPRVYVKGSALNPLTEPATEPIRVVAPAHPYLGPDLRVPPRASRRRDVPRGRVRMGHAART